MAAIGPYGLQMSAISSKALLKTADPYRYNAGSELEEELDYYNTFYRKYDAQIGRFTGVDIRSEESAAMSVYNFGTNNPVMFNDPLGDKFSRGNQMEEHPIDANWSYGTNPGIGNGFAGLGDQEADDGGGGGGNYDAFWGSLVNSFSKFKEGDRFGKHNGKFGFWQFYNFNTADLGYENAGGTATNLAEVSVGGGRKWISLEGISSNSFTLNNNPPFPTVVNTSVFTVWIQPEDGSKPQAVKPGARIYTRIDGITHPSHPQQIYKVRAAFDVLFGVTVTNSGILIDGNGVLWPLMQDVTEIGGGGWKSPPFGAPYFDNLFEKAGYKKKK